MKFIPLLIYEITLNILNAIKKIFTGIQNHEKHEIYLLIVCGVSFLLSLYSAWFLTIAFITLYPALHSHLSIHNGLIEIPTRLSSGQSEVTKEVKETLTEAISTQSADHVGDAIEDSQKNDDPEQTSSQQPKSEKKKQKNSQKAKEEWGLPTLRVVDQDGKIITVNPEKPTPIESEYFKGVILIMLKCDGEFSEYNRYADHFGKKQRKFEVQFQGQMKTLPKGEVMLGGELTEKMQVSFIMRSLLSFLMKFAMSLNPFLHFSFGEDPKADGKYECPHLTFPLFRVMDRVVVSAPGEELPELGKELPESEADRALRRNGKGVNCFKEGHTYSFSFHSMYVDFSRWIICNFPGYRAIDLTGFLGQQKVKVVCYELADPNSKSSDDQALPPYHYNNFKRYIMYMEMAHTSIMTPEEIASGEEDLGIPGDEEEHVGLESGAMITEESIHMRSDVEDSDSGSDDEFDHRSTVENPQPETEVSEVVEVDKEFDVGTLRPGAEYVLANTVVSLLSSSLPTDPVFSDGDHDDCFDPEPHYGIADVSGAAVRKECRDPPIIRFIRATTPVPVVPASQPTNLTSLRNPLTSLRRSIAVATQGGINRGVSRSGSITPSHLTSEDSLTIQSRSLEDIETNNILSAGDEIMIQCSSTGKYLTVHRGWWVYWTTYDSGLKSTFKLEILSSSGLSYAPHGTKLVSGMPFRLKSVKWPQWEVGCYDKPVSGRQLVVLFQCLSNPNRSAPTGPIRWGKNGQMVFPLSMTVVSDLSTPYNYNIKESDCKDIGDVSRRDSEEIVPLSFFDFQFKLEDSLHARDLKVDVVASAEVFNRKLNRAELAYVIRLSYTSNDNLVQWTTLRTQEDMDQIFNQIPPEQGGGSDITSPDANARRRRSYYGSITGLRTTSTSSPRFSSPVKLEQLKRATSFATVSARHQCSADQSVYLMSKRIQTILDQDVFNPSCPSPPPTTALSTTITTPPQNNRSVSTSSIDPQESPRSFTSSEVVASSDPVEFALPPSVLPVLGTSPKSASVLAAAVEGRGSDPIPQSQSTNEDVKFTFLKAFSKPELLDTLFLHDTDPEKYLPIMRREPTRIHSTLVARALWDTHWREEIAVLYSSYLACYPLLGTKPSWILSLQEIIGISYLPEEISPLPKFAVMRIETIGRVHYLAFMTKEIAHVMAAKIKEHITNVSFDTPIPSFVELTDPRDRFVVKSGRWRPAGRRLILNARKFTFDLQGSSRNINEDGSGSSPQQESYWNYSARLLKTVFQLDSNSSIQINSESLKRSLDEEDHVTPLDKLETATDELFPGKDKITAFLDETVLLKDINLHDEINFSSPEAFCFFVNIYHTLLVHARLILNPPSAKDWSSFYETVSYEIGSDVFSLSELEHCVICGKLERPIHVPRNFCLPPPLNDDHYAYALQNVDCRARFIVNCCSISNLPTIYLLTPDNLFHHLNEASIAVFDTYLDVNVKNKTVTLPKLLETFKGDFGGSPQEVLRHILRYLGKENWGKISILLTSPRPPFVKYLDMKCISHDSLQLIA